MKCRFKNFKNLIGDLWWGDRGEYSNVNVRVFSLFSPSLFILLHSIKFLVGGDVVGSTPSLAINIDSYVYTCIRVLRVL